jgi:hypothetical protein
MEKYDAPPLSKAYFIRVLEMWPYLLLAISVGGFAYKALNNVR